MRDLLGGVQRPAADEHRAPAEQRLLLRREEIMAPGDGVAQGPLARWQIAATVATVAALASVSVNDELTVPALQRG